MSRNQQVILQTIIDQTKNESSPDSTIDDYFHAFVSEQVLKDLDLSYDEIEEGIVDNGGDGGIDAIYTFVNKELIQRDSDLIEGKRGSDIDVYIIQSKNTNGFSESAIEKCDFSAKDLLDFDKEIDSLRTVYNNDLLTNIDVFRRQYLHLASKFPNLNFHYFYATKGIEVHPNVERKVEVLVGTITNHFDNATVNFEFLTAHRLIELYRKEKLTSKDILLKDNPITTQDGGYIAIVPIENYYDFITDEQNDLIKYFFDANIRDYQVNVEVNKEIRQTLNSINPEEDFWWLNNGITITCTYATFASKRLHIEDPQIVNGLQTSFEIAKYFSGNKIESDERNVLIRVIKATNEKSRLKVIKATNSQTNIPPASLRATDPIHRDIEDYLLSKGFYYDRRKNYHKNQGRPKNKIISIPFLAQVVMSIKNRKPDYARARPSTLIKKNADYEQIFNENIPLELYYKLISIQKKVETGLKEFDSPKLTRTQLGDVKFHVSMYVVLRVLAKIKPNKDDLSKIDLAQVTDSILYEAIENVYVIYDAMGGTNSVAKGSEFVDEVIELVKEKNEAQHGL